MEGPFDNQIWRTCKNSVSTKSAISSKGFENNAKVFLEKEEKGERMKEEKRACLPLSSYTVHCFITIG